MKIAVFSDTYGDINGVAITIDELVRYARARNLPLDVFTQVAEGDSIESLGSVRIFRFRMLAPVRLTEGLSFDLRVLNRRILRRMREEGYDIVHSEGQGSIGIAANRFTRRLGIPFVGSYNTDIPSYIGPFVKRALRPLGRGVTHRIAAIGEKGAWAFNRRLFRGCDAVLAPSEWTRRVLEQQLGRPVTLFPRGVDLSVFNPSARRREAGDDAAKPVALYVGRFSAEKNVDVLVDLFRSRNHVHLQLAGYGPLIGEVCRQLPGARYLGAIRDRAELARVFASADIFVMPSETETYGQVIVEAAACGLPAIVSSRGASHENVTHGVTGFVAGSLAEFHQALDVLLSQAATRRAMGEAARRFALDRSWERVFDGLLRTYQKVVRERTATP